MRSILNRAKRGVKDMVIQAAKNIFANYGFRKTTMNEIAKAMHMSKGSLYYYFRSKEEIFEAIVEQEFRTLKADIVQAISAVHSPQEKLRAFFHSRFLGMQKATNFYKAVIEEYFDYFSYIEGLRKALDIQEMKIINDILNEGVKTGIFFVNSVEATTMALRAGLRGIEYDFLIVKKNFKQLVKIQDLILNTFLNGILKR
jgi:AcrR family transcriptional regulator